MKQPRKPEPPPSRPANPDAERAVLGAFLLEPTLLDDALAAGLKAADFSLDSHRRIFARMLDLANSERPLDLISLGEELGRHRELEAVGGAAYLADLTTGSVAHKKHVQYHVAIVMTKARLRRIIAVGQHAQDAACEPGADPLRVVREVMTELERIGDTVLSGASGG